MNKILIALYTVLTAVSLILLKMGTLGGIISTENGSIALNLGFLAILGIFTYGLSFLMYIILVSKYELGFIVSLTTALVYIIVFTASFVIFKETFTILKIIAIGFILAGVVLLNRETGREISSR